MKQPEPHRPRGCVCLTTAGLAQHAFAELPIELCPVHQGAAVAAAALADEVAAARQHADDQLSRHRDAFAVPEAACVCLTLTDTIRLGLSTGITAARCPVHKPRQQHETIEAYADSTAALNPSDAALAASLGIGVHQINRNTTQQENPS